MLYYANYSGDYTKIKCRVVSGNSRANYKLSQAILARFYSPKYIAPFASRSSHFLSQPSNSLWSFCVLDLSLFPGFFEDYEATSPYVLHFSPNCQSLTRVVQGQGELIAAQQRRLEAQVRHAEKTSQEKQEGNIWQHTNMTHMTHMYHMTFWYILTLKTSSSPEEKTCFKWLRTSDSELELPATRSSKCKCWKNESPSKMTSLPRWSAVSVTHCLHTLRLWLCSLKRLEELRAIDMQSYCRQMPSSWKDQQLQEQQLQLQQQVRDGQGHPNLKYQPVQKALLRLNPCVLKTVRPHNFLLWTRVLRSCILSWPVSNPIQSLRQWIRIMSTVSWKFVSNISMSRINGWSKMTSSSTSISNSSNNRNADSDWATGHVKQVTFKQTIF